jgi:hypothetical protein
MGVWSTGRSSQSISAKPVGVGAAFQRLILTGERSGSQTYNRGQGKRFVNRADEKLTAFVELDAAIRSAERPEDCRGREIKLDKLSRIK